MEVNAEGINIAAAVETTQGQSTPPTTGWLNLEADAIGDPGPQYKKMARSPFTITRQLRRPFIAGLDAALSLDLDAIKDHVDFLGPAIFKSDWKHAGGTGQSFFRPTAVTATGYTVASLGALADNTLVIARGFTNAENNGLKVLAGTSTGTEIKCAGLTIEASPPANATIEVCGFQFAAGDLELSASGHLTATAKNLTQLGLQVGQFCYLPTAAEALAMGSALYGFSNTAYTGFFEVTASAAGQLTIRRRGWTVGAATAEATSTVRLFFTKWIRNVARSHADENIVSHCFEVTYPGLAAGPADAYEYLKGYMLDQVTFNIPSEGKVTMQAAFIGMEATDPSASRETGPSTALNVVTSLAVSTSSDITRLVVDDVDEVGLMSDFQDLKIMLKNNIAGEKAVGHLGNRFTPLGVFEAQVEAEVYFTSPDMVTAVSDNRILRLAAGMRNDDFGMVIDIPSTGAMESPKKIEHNKLITVSSKIAGFMDGTSGYTAGLSMFAYLPTA
jgi:hypothetical protein